MPLKLERKILQYCIKYGRMNGVLGVMTLTVFLPGRGKKGQGTVANYNYEEAHVSCMCNLFLSYDTIITNLPYTI